MTFNWLKIADRIKDEPVSVSLQLGSQLTSLCFLGEITAGDCVAHVFLERSLELDQGTGAGKGLLR